MKVVIDGKTERDNPQEEGGQTAGVSGPGCRDMHGMDAHIPYYKVPGHWHTGSASDSSCLLVCTLGASTLWLKGLGVRNPE